MYLIISLAFLLAAFLTKADFNNFILLCAISCGFGLVAALFKIGYSIDEIKKVIEKEKDNNKDNSEK